MGNDSKPRQIDLLAPKEAKGAKAKIAWLPDDAPIELGVLLGARDAKLIKEAKHDLLLLVGSEKDLDDSALYEIGKSEEEDGRTIFEFPVGKHGAPDLEAVALVATEINEAEEADAGRVLIDATASAQGASFLVTCLLVARRVASEEAARLACDLCGLDEKAREAALELADDFKAALARDEQSEEEDFEDEPDDEPLDENEEESQNELAPKADAVAEEPESPARPALEVLPTLRPRQDGIAGAVLGAAIGDAMGHPTEFIGSVAAIQQKYGPDGVTKFELYWDRGGKHFAPYTDDTQMAEAVLRALLDAPGGEDSLDDAMVRMGERFVAWAKNPQGGHRAPGNACLAGCNAIAAGTHWSKAGGAQAGGCGSVMRAYPFGLVFADDLARAERWSVEHSKLTHRDPIALAACAAMAVGVALALRGEKVGAISSEMVAAACRYSPRTAAMMATAIEEARGGVKPDVTLERLRSWAAHEAIAAAVYILERHPDDPRAAILEGTNTPGDSDSIATLAGALVGARCGARALPQDWVRDVERADELLELALRIR